MTLEVGQTTESIVVEASTLLVQTTESLVTHGIVRRDIEVLPQLSRLPIPIGSLRTGRSD